MSGGLGVGSSSQHLPANVWAQLLARNPECLFHDGAVLSWQPPLFQPVVDVASFDRGAERRSESGLRSSVGDGSFQGGLRVHGVQF